jgi:hypothetical protein
LFRQLNKIETEEQCGCGNLQTCSLAFVEVKLRSTVSRPVRLGVRHPSRTSDQFFFLLEIFFRELRVRYFVAHSLTRGRVCNLLLLLVLAAVPLGSESRGTQDHILLSELLRLPQPGGPGPRIYIPQEQGGPDIPPGTGLVRTCTSCKVSCSTHILTPVVPYYAPPIQFVILQFLYIKQIDD